MPRKLVTQDFLEFSGIYVGIKPFPEIRAGISISFPTIRITGLTNFLGTSLRGRHQNPYFILFIFIFISGG